MSYQDPVTTREDWHIQTLITCVANLEYLQNSKGALRPTL